MNRGVLLRTGGPRWEPTSPRSSMSTTQKIRSIGREARVNELIRERLEHWKAAMRERGPSLALLYCHMYYAINRAYPSPAHGLRHQVSSDSLVKACPLSRWYHLALSP